MRRWSLVVVTMFVVVNCYAAVLGRPAHAQTPVACVVPVPEQGDGGGLPGDAIDDGAAIRQAIADATACAGPSEVRFEPGDYLVGRPPAVVASRGDHLAVTGAVDLTLRGDETLLVMSDPNLGGIAIYDSRRVTVSGLAIDYAAVPFTQGEVIAVDLAASTFTLEVHDGYPGLGEGSIFPFPTWGTLRDGDTGIMKRGVVDYLNVSWIETDPTRQHTFILTVPERISEVEVGDGFVTGVRARAGVWVETSSYTVIGSVSVYTAPGSAFVSYRSDGTVLRNSRVLIRPGTDRWLSTTADGFHHQAGRVGPRVINNVFEGMNDDGLNVYSPPLPVTAVVGASITATGYTPTRVGDLVTVFDPVRGIERGDAIVDTITGQYVFTMTLRAVTPGDDVPGAVTGDFLHNRSNSGAGFEVRGNLYREYRGRGLVLDADDGVVADNQMTDLSGVGIYASNDPNWPEGVVPRRLLIQGNTLTRVARNGAGTAILVRGTRLGYTTAEGRIAADITLRRNRIVDPPRFAIVIGGARDVLVEDTSVVVPNSSRPFDAPTSIVALDNVNEIVIRRLTIRDRHDPTRPCTYVVDPATIGPDITFDRVTVNGVVCAG